MPAADTNYPAVLAITIEDGDILHRGSGVLLHGGRYLLTAAHLFQADTRTTDISLISSTGHTLPAIKRVHRHPEWNTTTYNNDLALIELSQPVNSVTGLSLYRGAVPTGSTFIRAGYGDGSTNPQHIGTNIWDSTGDILNDIYNRQVTPGSQLLYDYDDGTQAHNILGHLAGNEQSSATPTADETIARSGDSGGPGLLNNQVASIASYVIADPKYDSDSDNAGTPGEAAADTYVGHYLPWIDQITGLQTPPVPEQAASVEQQPHEADSINYFLLHSDKTQQHPIRLWYQTLDGTATAGQDYLKASGWVEISAGQQQAAIAIQLLDDAIPEPDETFYLEISDPGGQWLQEPLTTAHTLIDNDLFSG